MPEQILSERITKAAFAHEQQGRTLRTAQDMAALNDFIIALSESPEKVAAFAASPDDVLVQAGVSPELSGVVKAGYSYLVSRGLKVTVTGGGLGAADGGSTTVVVVVVVVV
jgi:hypothetical protein